MSAIHVHADMVCARPWCQNIRQHIVKQQIWVAISGKHDCSLANKHIAHVRIRSSLLGCWRVWTTLCFAVVSSQLWSTHF